MTKKRVLKRVKKPCPKKDGVVARRASKNSLLLESRRKKRGAPIKFDGCRRSIKPPRLTSLASRKRRRDADKAAKRKEMHARSFPVMGLAEVDDFVIDMEIHEVSRTSLSQDRLTGDNGIPE